MTPEQQKVVDELHDEGYCLVIWTPEEIGGADIGDLESIMIERGGYYLEGFVNECEEQSDDQN